jgi:hypothetical protein
VARHVPALPLPRAHTARHRLQQQGDPGRRQAPEGRARHEPCQTTIARTLDLVAAARGSQGAGGVVVCAAWSLAADWLQVVARRRQDWSSRLQTHRRLETARVQRCDVTGWALKRPGPPLAVAALVPRLPATADRALQVREPTSWGFTRGGRIAGLGTVRSVVRCADEAWTGRAGVRVSKRVDGSAATIMRLYRQRWPTATCDPDRQGHLGFTAYRLRRIDAMGHHGGVGCVASSLRHWTCRPAVPDRTPGLIHTRGDACRPPGRALRQRLWGCVHDPVSHGATGDHRLTP